MGTFESLPGMGILRLVHGLGIISGGFFKEKSKSSSSRKEDTTKTLSGTQTSAGTSQTVGEAEQTTTLLDQDVQQFLKDLILGGGAGGGVGGSALQEAIELGSGLSARAQTAEEDLGGFVEDILSNARREGTRELTRLGTDLAQSTGSAQNSFVAGALGEGRADLESQLAALGGELGLKVRQTATEEATGALQGLLGGSQGANQQSDALMNIVQQLRGATATQVGTTKESTSEQEAVTKSLVEVIDSLITGAQSGKSSGFDLGAKLTT